MSLSIWINTWERVRVTPELFTDNYDSTTYSSQQGGMVDLSYKFNDDFVNFSFQANDIKNKTSSYSYLSGSQSKYILGFDQRWVASKMSYKAYAASYGYQDTTTLASSYKTTGFSLGYTQYVSSFDFYLGAVIESKKYNSRASTDTKTRTDQRTYLNAQLGYAFATYFRAYLDASITNNVSNYDQAYYTQISATNSDKNYKQNLLLMGLSFNY